MPRPTVGRRCGSASGRLGWSPDFNADEAVWGWAREEATGNLCLGSREAVQDRVDKFLAGLSSRKDEVRRRCRTVLQSRAETLLRDSRLDSHHPANAHPTLAKSSQKPRFSPSRRFLIVYYPCNSGLLTRITYTTMLYKAGTRLLGVARNPANGFPARLLGIAGMGSISIY